MRKVFVFVSCVTVVLILSKVSFAESAETPSAEPSQLSVESIVAEVQPGGATIWRPAAPHALPFGYPPYPSIDGHPAYGVPYSYPRAPRRLGSRLAPPVPYQPHPLPALGAAPGVSPPPTQPMVRGQAPMRQGVLGVAPASGVPMGQPTVVYRPTPIKNFMTLITAPRPYIGFDPYAGYPPFPGYIPPQ